MCMVMVEAWLGFSNFEEGGAAVSCPQSETWQDDDVEVSSILIGSSIAICCSFPMTRFNYVN